jgi:cytochrome c-type biogenesis protein CcmE
VEQGSVQRTTDDGHPAAKFRVTDGKASVEVSYQGILPDLFREGQGIVAMGAFDRDGVFIASQVLAKHDEKYMPRALAQALKAQGEWRGNGRTPAYATASSLDRP